MNTMRLLRPHTTLLTRREAESVAARNLVDETDGWTYTAVQRPGSEWWTVEVRDEDGDLVGRL